MEICAAPGPERRSGNFAMCHARSTLMLRPRIPNRGPQEWPTNTANVARIALPVEVPRAIEEAAKSRLWLLE